MRIAVSPYHLTTREPPAMAALLLAESVVTLAPSLANGQRSESARVLGYAAFMNSWAWTVPLWKAGVLAAESQGESAIEDVRAIASRVEGDEAFAGLRRFMHPELLEDDRAYLSAVAVDVLKGGPDPGINVPLTAGLDRFATRHGLLVARAQPSSVVQSAEARMGERLSAVALPVLLQADAKRLLHAREVLAGVLAGVRQGLATLAESEGVETAPLAAAASAYTTAFQDQREDVLEDCACDEVRAVEGAATISIVRLPSDAALRASMVAVSGLERGPAPTNAIVNTALPVLRDPYAGRTFLSLVVKPLGAAPPRRR